MKVNGGMDLETVLDKDLHELERLAKELLDVIRKTKLEEPALTEMLRQLETKAGEIRRQRFDGDNSEFRGY